MRAEDFSDGDHWFRVRFWNSQVVFAASGELSVAEVSEYVEAKKLRDAEYKKVCDEAGIVDRFLSSDEELPAVIVGN